MGIMNRLSVMDQHRTIGPCDACVIMSKYRPDHHALAVTACGRALCRGCDCGGDCYDRHVPSCDACIKISNQEVANQMVAEARESVGLDPNKVTITNQSPPRRWA